MNRVTVNIGSRQSGRLMPNSVVNCELNSLKIKKILDNFNSYKRKNFNNLFYKKDTLNKISNKIKKIMYLEKKIKVFYEK